MRLWYYKIVSLSLCIVDDLIGQWNLVRDVSHTLLIIEYQQRRWT